MQEAVELETAGIADGILGAVSKVSGAFGRPEQPMLSSLGSLGAGAMGGNGFDPGAMLASLGGGGAAPGGGGLGGALGQLGQLAGGGGAPAGGAPAGGGLGGAIAQLGQLAGGGGGGGGAPGGGDAVSAVTGVVGTLGDLLQTTGEGGRKVGSVISAAGHYAALGASLGSAIPGLGTVVGGVAGAIVGIGASIADLFKKKTRPLNATEQRMWDEGKAASEAGDPFPMIAATTFIWNKPAYAGIAKIMAAQSAALRAGTLGNSFASKAQKIDATHGAQLQSLGLTETEQRLLGIASVAGASKPMLGVIEGIRRDVANSLLARASSDPGMTRAQAPGASDRPSPDFHLGQTTMAKAQFAALLQRVPALRALPDPVLAELAGLRGRATDTAGIDPADRSYVEEPGDTAETIARKLVSDPRRAGELLAANPLKDPWSPRWRLPPSWFGFIPYQRAADEAAGVDYEDDDDAGALASEWGPAGVLDTGDPTVIVPEPDGDNPPDLIIPETKPGPKPAPKPAPKGSGSEGSRANLTARVHDVKNGEWPMKIAQIIGASPARPQWWHELKDANPHKLTTSDGNWKTLFGGEIINIPDAWPASAATRAAPGGSTIPANPFPVPGGPGVPGAPTIPALIPGAATVDPGVLIKAQAQLAFWVSFNKSAADPNDYGQNPLFSQDLNGVPSERMQRVTRSFQLWSNSTNPGVGNLNTIGLLDAATMAALNAYFQAKISGGTLPPGTVPGLGGAVPGLGGAVPGGGVPGLGGAVPGLGGGVPGLGGGVPGLGGGVPGLGGGVPGLGGGVPRPAVVEDEPPAKKSDGIATVLAPLVGFLALFS
jgi:hypothetical protein